jgi:predicted nucleic acid-binding protein
MTASAIGKRIAIKVKYLDASAIVKLFLDEDGSKAFREYFFSHTNYCTTRMTFYEAMSVLKSRLFKNSTKSKYYQAMEELAIHGWGGKIEIESIELNDMDVFKEVSKLSMAYDLDVADAIQIYSILKGKYRRLINESSSVLITADDKLEYAAKTNGIRVWNCRNNVRPDWLDN